MAMDGTKMGDEVAAAVCSGAATPEGIALSKQMWEKVCTAIVAHIVNNAEVPAGIAVSTSGNASSHIGATTAAGNVV